MGSFEDLNGAGGNMNILELIANGESKKIEFKELIDKNLSSVIKTVMAFANSGGGQIIIGVQDKTQKIVGVEEDQLAVLSDRISSSIFDSVNPKINFEIERYAIQGKIVLLIQVYPGNQPPYYLISEGKNQGVFIRVGATTRKADQEIISELERQKLNISFDQEIAHGFSEQDLDFKYLIKYSLDTIGKKLKKEDLLNLNLLVKNKNSLLPTAGGVLLCGRKSLHDNCYISCALFKGQTTDVFINKKEFHGSLIKQVEGAMSFLKQHIPLKAEIGELQRKEKYEIPLIALREALINCVVHRDYNARGSHIKLAIFDDRIEFISPGSLPKSIDIQDITVGRSEIRNKVIARFFKEIGFIEQWGTGIQKIIYHCKKENLKDPNFQETGLFFKVTIFRTKKRASVNEISEQEKLILEFLKTHPYIKNSQAQEILSVSASRVRVIFENMVNKNLLVSSGVGKGKVYKAKKL